MPSTSTSSRTKNSSSSSPTTACHSTALSNTPFALLLVNRQLHAETQLLPYPHGTIAFSTTPSIRAFLLNSSEAQRRSIKSLALQTYCSIYMFNELKALRANDVAYVSSFPELRHFEIWNIAGCPWEQGWKGPVGWIRGTERFTEGRVRRVWTCDENGKRDGRYVCLEKGEVCRPAHEGQQSF
jgi:hypothetical protein